MDQNFLNTVISIFEKNVVSYLKPTKLKKKVVEKVTFPFGLELLNAVLETVSAKENYQ